MKKRLLAAALAACLTLALMPVRALAAGHRFQPVTDDPYDNWVCADCGAIIDPGLKDAYEAVSALDGETLPRDEERTQRAVQAYTQRLTEDTLDTVGWCSCTLSELGYTAPDSGRDGTYRYTVTIQSYGRARPLADVTTAPLTLIIPSLGGSSGPGASGFLNPGYWQPKPDVTPGPSAADRQRAELEQLLWFAWLARRYATMPFTDVTREHWAYPGVNYVWRNNLMSGVSDSAFDPDAPAARSDVWAVLARMSGYRKAADSGDPWYAPSMDWAVRQGLTDGTDPLGTLTREDLAVMLWRKASGPLVPADLTRFSDSGRVSGYAQNAVSWAVSRGIIQGSDGLLAPRAAVSRAELATMVMRSVPGSY